MIEGKCGFDADKWASTTKERRYKYKFCHERIEKTVRGNVNFRLEVGI